MAVIHIKIISDAVCPFCYVGKKRLERAIDVYRKTVPGGADDRFAVTWLPFYLDPYAPAVGVPTTERMAQKFGADRAQTLIAHIRAVGAAEGIDFTYEGKAGSTRDAHRLVEFAKQKEQEGRQQPGDSQLQDKLISRLFTSYFEQGGDVTSRDTLVAVAEQAGLDGAEARAWLQGDGGGAKVDAEVKEAYARGVHGVPHFIINDRAEINGAQDVATFVRELVKAREG